MTVKLKITKSYGREVIYIIDPEFNKIFQTLTGKKTISRQDVDQFKLLGINFVVIPEVL
jgi:hypothetical protein